jgi:hypothetical protein
MNVDRHNFAIISHFDLLPNARLIECLPTSSHFFFAITSLANCHRFALDRNIASPFYLAIEVAISEAKPGNGQKAVDFPTSTQPTGDRTGSTPIALTIL